MAVTEEASDNFQHYLWKIVICNFSLERLTIIPCSHNTPRQPLPNSQQTGMLPSWGKQKVPREVGNLRVGTAAASISPPKTKGHKLLKNNLMYWNTIFTLPWLWKTLWKNTFVTWIWQTAAASSHHVIMLTLVTLTPVNFLLQKFTGEPGAGYVVGWWVPGVTQQARLSRRPDPTPPTQLFSLNLYKNE